MSNRNGNTYARLGEIARRAMLDHGLLAEFSARVRSEVERLAAAGGDQDTRDLRNLPWASIDNDDSRDLDQLTVAEPLAAGSVRLLVAVADVDALVPRGSAVDDHAAHNTTSVYTAGGVFPMLPDRLSTDLTSLSEGNDRLALVADMVIAGGEGPGESSVYHALVRNRAKLAYNSLAEWLEGKSGPPAAVERVPGLAENLRVQDRVAQGLKEQRHRHGALSLQTVEARPVFADGALAGLEEHRANRATQLIEDFMIAANEATVRFLREKGLPTVRRVLRSPEKWARIVELAARHGEALPPEPDAAALDGFLKRRRSADPAGFADLSLSVVKLIGKGEYVAQGPAGQSPGHFGLAVRDYTHSTAPNRRFPDLITQRLVKAALAGRPAPYADGELAQLAGRCTAMEDAANKVERQVLKSAAALILQGRLGEAFDGIVTGAAPKGTWVRIFDPPVEGKVVRGFAGLGVGDRVRVKLVRTDMQRGFIDFAR